MIARKRKKKKGWPAYLKITMTVMVVLIIAAAIRIYEDVLASNINLDASQTAYIYIYTNKPFALTLDKIKEQKIMRNTNAFARLVRLLGYEKKMRPGRYEVDGSMSNLSLLRLFASGKQEPLDVVFKYAERKNDLAAFWAKHIEADSNEIVALLNNSNFLDSLGLDTQTAISLFIPNTYNFYWNTSALKLCKRMAEEYRQFWDSTRIAKSEFLGLLPSQVAIMASIVQKETYKKEEMPVVAGVYYNRLRKGMPFQADPTIIYAMNDKSIKRVYGKMLSVESPYNTYKYKGLIPGPICVPSSTAIDAVLNMRKHNYIYFCAREDFSGYHNFASTFAQHQINAARYQRMLNKKRIR